MKITLKDLKIAIIIVLILLPLIYFYGIMIDNRAYLFDECEAGNQHACLKIQEEEK